LTVRSCHDPPCILDESLEAAANIVENNEFIYYNNKEDGDTVMSSVSESKINDNDDDSNIYNVLSNLINKAADLSPFRYKSPL
jgi:hypothetical protein